MPVRWGLLSTALINEAIIAGAAESDRAEIAAVASREPARADTYARAHDIPKAHGSYEALLADADVDAIYVSLPNSLHVEWSIRALEAGKHVLCEKPMSRHAADVERAFDVAEANGLVLSEAFMWRHNPQTKRLRELVTGGAVGPLRVVRAAFGFPLEATRGADDTRFRPDLEGGALMDIGSYCLSAIRLFLGEPKRLRGEQVVGPSGVDVVFSATLGYEGAVGHFDCSFVSPSRRELELVGEDGVLLVRDPFPIQSPGIELHRGGEIEQIPIEPANSYRLELDNVSAAIAGEEELLLGRDDAVGQARAIEALYASSSASAMSSPSGPRM
jgi:D-xylose 1-dehydrogenase (NADP+, D-xylono-1,5-lactone-forming)